MGLIDLATAPLRYVINEVTEHEAEVVSPLKDIEEIQAHLLGAVEAIKLWPPGRSRRTWR